MGSHFCLCLFILQIVFKVQCQEVQEEFRTDKLTYPTNNIYTNARIRNLSSVLNNFQQCLVHVVNYQGIDVEMDINGPPMILTRYVTVDRRNWTQFVKYEAIHQKHMYSNVSNISFFYTESLSTENYWKPARFPCLFQVYLYPPHDINTHPISFSKYFLSIPTSFSNFWAYEPYFANRKLRKSVPNHVFFSISLKTDVTESVIESYTRRAYRVLVSFEEFQEASWILWNKGMDNIVQESHYANDLVHLVTSRSSDDPGSNAHQITQSFVVCHFCNHLRRTRIPTRNLGSGKTIINVHQLEELNQVESYRPVTSQFLRYHYDTPKEFSKLDCQSMKFMSLQMYENFRQALQFLSNYPQWVVNHELTTVILGKNSTYLTYSCLSAKKRLSNCFGVPRRDPRNPFGNNSKVPTKTEFCERTRQQTLDKIPLPFIYYTKSLSELGMQNPLVIKDTEMYTFLSCYQTRTNELSFRAMISAFDGKTWCCLIAGNKS
jgi:hypothetical protein